VIPRTRFVIPSITLGAVLLGIYASATEKPFEAGAAREYAHQTSDQVTIGAKSFDNEELTSSAFGKKTDLLRYGVLAVLVVVENKRDKAIDLRDLQVNLVAADGRHASAVSPEDVPFMATEGRHPNQSGVHMPVPIPLPKKKNLLETPSIVERAFSAKMLPAGDSASGFFYFEAKPESGDKVYLSGLRDARSGQEIMYFEFPLNQ
jgi:hypothetical protein